MTKKHIPNSAEEVFAVMKDYSEKKGYSFTDTQLRFIAENCFLSYESKEWCGTKYWPPLVMKWLLNERGKFNKGVSTYKKPQGKSVRDKIMEQENDKE